jgi:hypothetical protein
MESSRPLAGARRVTRPTAKLADGNNAEKAPFAFQRVAVEAENARVKAMQLSMLETDSDRDTDASASLPTLPHSNSSHLLSASPSLLSTRQTSPILSDVGSDDTPPTGTKYHRHTILSSDEEETPENAPKKKRKKRTHTANENGRCQTYSLRNH